MIKINVNKREFLFIFFCITFIWYMTNPAILAASQKEGTVSIKISAVGDCTLGIDKSQVSLNNFNKEYQKQSSPAYFFEKTSSIFEKDDLTIANFEGTLTSSNNRANKTFAFKGPSSYAKILTSGSIEAVNLANNHTMDYGKTGYADTTRALSKKNITYFNGSKIAVKKINGIKVGLIGVDVLPGLWKKEELKEAVKKCREKKARLIIVSFHWGVERDYYPNKKQKAFAHWAIDYGADLVLGHHPHVLQGIEKYKGKYIAYSLGNFCFGGNTNPKDKDTMIFQQTFVFENGRLAKDNPVNVIPCSLSSVKTRNNYQPLPLKGKEKNRVLKKLNTLSLDFGIQISANGQIKENEME